MKPAPAPVEESAEPDWKARYQSLRKRLANAFEGPAVGESMAVKLKSGTERTGILTALTENEVTVSFGAAEVSYPRAALSAQTRAKLFAEDFAHVRATELVQRDRAAFRKQHAAEPMARVADVAKVAQKPARSGKPSNDPNDQSVWQVKDYLNKTLKDPDSIRYQEWSPVMKTDRGYQVVCTYEAQAGSFGMVTEKKVFHMTRSGQVTSVSPVRMNLEK